MSPARKRVGIVGFGHLGQYLYENIRGRNDLEVCFVWNRTNRTLTDLDQSIVCEDLNNFEEFNPDLVVEVAHPDITKQYGEKFLASANYFIGSPTALSEATLENSLRRLAENGPYGLYVPAGALWGGPDIRKMANLGTLKGLEIIMKKHPTCFKLESPLKEINESVLHTPVTLYDGPIRNLCALAPNNVNTMAAAAIAAHNLGFDGVRGSLVSDPSLKDRHIVSVRVEGLNGFSVTTERINPANLAVVTGHATYHSFLASVVSAGESTGAGVHLC